MNVDNMIDIKMVSSGSALISPICLNKYSRASSYLPGKNEGYL